MVTQSDTVNMWAISPFRTLFALTAASLHFVSANKLAVLRKIALPSLLIPFVVYVCGRLYLLEVEKLLRSFDEQTASLVLAIPVIGLLVAMFINAFASVGVASLVLERSPLPRPMIAHPHWRMFSACLRFLLLAFATVISVVTFVQAVPMEFGKHSVFVVGSITFSFLSYLSVRLCLLVAPLSLMETGSILRRGWSLTTGRVHIYAIVTWVVLVGIVWLSGATGEAVVRSTLGEPVSQVSWNLPALAILLQRLLPALIAGVALSYAVGVTLFSITSVHLYCLARAGGFCA